MFFVVIGSWIATGLLIGFVASKIVNLRGDDPKFGICAAAAGALGAGVLYVTLGASGVGTWSWWGLLYAAAGAIVAVVVWHLVRSRSISHERYVPRSSY
jgi:uncharacterized membrane protein YeaQ/YmgE (transglycosylase-associated protein family)